MTEEEKKTFNFLKTFVKTEIDYCKLEKADVIDILNIIEKLQKENEELKNKVIKRDNDIIYLEETAEKEFLTKQEVKENYISKDKIRKLEDMWNDNIWNATDDESKAKAEMIRDVYRGLLNE